MCDRNRKLGEGHKAINEPGGSGDDLDRSSLSSSSMAFSPVARHHRLSFGSDALNNSEVLLMILSLSDIKYILYILAFLSTSSSIAAALPGRGRDGSSGIFSSSY